VLDEAVYDVCCVTVASCSSRLDAHLTLEPPAKRVNQGVGGASGVGSLECLDHEEVPCVLVGLPWLGYKW
jgi:hypothetical protein